MMDAEEFIRKKCYFTTVKMGKLNTHAKKIHVIHNVGSASDEKPRTTPLNGFYTEETFDKIINELAAPRISSRV